MDYIWAVLRGLPPNWSLVIMSLQPNQKEKDYGWCPSCNRGERSGIARWTINRKTWCSLEREMPFDRTSTHARIVGWVTGMSMWGRSKWGEGRPCWDSQHLCKWIVMGIQHVHPYMLKALNTHQSILTYMTHCIPQIVELLRYSPNRDKPFFDKPWFLDKPRLPCASLCWVLGRRPFDKPCFALNRGWRRKRQKRFNAVGGVLGCQADMWQIHSQFLSFVFSEAR